MLLFSDTTNVVPHIYTHTEGHIKISKKGKHEAGQIAFRRVKPWTKTDEAEKERVLCIESVLQRLRCFLTGAAAAGQHSAHTISK